MTPSTPASSGEGRRRNMLLRKAWADSRALSRETLSLMVLVALGVALFVGLYEAYQNLGIVYEAIYRQTRFADVSAQFDAGPAALVDTAGTIPGVRVAIGRVARDGAIIQRGRERERVLGRFIGVPRDQSPRANDLWLLEGRYLSGPDDAVLEHQFADDNGYIIGDRLKASFEGRIREFTVVGFAASPEYLYPVPSRHALFVARGTFGVVFVEQEHARAWFGMGRSINEIHCLTEPGRRQEVLEKLEGLTRGYGLDFAFVQDDQPSKHLLDMDMEAFATLSVFFPVLFLVSAGLSLYGTMNRIIRLQVTIIGTLRACGFTQREILLQHLLQGALIPVGGAIPGIIFGHALAFQMNRLYAQELRLPMTSAAIHWDTVFVGLLLAILTGLIAAYIPARTAARIPPALAMRGETDTGRSIRAQELVLGWTSRAPIAYRIPLRGVFRRASRTMFAVAGIAGGAVIIITTLGLYVSMMDLYDEFLLESRRYEFDLSFTRPQGALVARGAAALPGGRAMGLTCSLPVDIRSSWDTADLVLTGIQPGQDLLRVRTGDGECLCVTPGTIWLPEKVAQRLRLEAGDPVHVEWTGSSRRRRVATTMRMAGVLDVTMGGSAYGDYREVRRLADRIWPASSYGAHFACNPALVEQFKQRFERSDDIALVSTTADVRAQVDEQMALSFIFLGVLIIFGSILAGAAIHGVASMSLLERTRELASLRSLGFSAWATARLAAAELLLLALLGLLVGLPLGAWLNSLYLGAYETETMALRAFLPLWTYVATALVVLLLVAYSAWAGARRLRAMDLSQAVKAQE